MITDNINLIAVYVADYLGIMLLVLVLLAKGWDLPGRKGESRILLLLILASLFDCLIDPFIFRIDGKPGAFNRFVIVYGNSALFLYNLVVGTGVLALVAKHINKKISRAQYITVFVLTLIESIVLIVNLFTPIVFYVDENNTYTRKPLYFLFIFVAVYLLGYSLVLYFSGRLKDGSLRYFPVWEFMIPITAGVLIQTFYYGISTQPSSFAIAFTSMVVCLQKEYLYIDKLTGVYNRYEFDKIIDYYVKRRKRKFAAIMLDMNGFKEINDQFSHVEGDEALKNMANILTKVVGNDGNVIRFAGDEFVVVTDAEDEAAVDTYCNKIREALDEYNSKSGKPYRLSASMGGEIFNICSAAEVIERIDDRMYANKVEYYKDHDRRSR
ncbi:MAG: GGDEF domain-containing protein [Lachnospiraceae bacterium]|nr:GGDEF domain-containing protein [Lachnospiraceae bacterium]